MFEMDQQLLKDTIEIGDFTLCRVLLMNDSRYPWLILVPRCEGVSEMFELTPTEQQQLWQETSHAGRVLKNIFQADKINIATLGNVVKQLHMHVVVRMQGDDAWPAPVWGKGSALAYTEEAIKDIRQRLEVGLIDFWVASSEVGV